MKSEDVGSLPIVEEDRLIGVVTDRDLALRVIAEGRRRRHARGRDRLEGRRHDRPAAEPRGGRAPDGGAPDAAAARRRGGRQLVGILAQADVAQAATTRSRARSCSRSRSNGRCPQIGVKEYPRPADTACGMGVAVYTGPFGREQAERLLWRAGFGPRPGEAAGAREARPRRRRPLAHPPGRREARRPGAARRQGPPARARATPGATTTSGGSTGWCARARPLVERMTLVWHDWFATSNRRRRLAEADARPEPAAAPPRARLVRRRCCSRSRKDPAMLLWLSGTENTKWSPNENYARELMELFTLGAGSGYTERDVREQARALTGLTNDWKRGAGNVNFRFDRERHDAGHEAHLRQDAARSTGGTPCRLCLQPPAAPVVLRRQALELLHPDRAGRGDAARARGALPQGLRDPPGRRGDPAPPALYTGPADGQAAGRLHRRPAARRSAAASTRPSWVVARRREPASGSSCRRTSPAGTTTRWLDTATFRGRWLIANYASAAVRARPTKQAADAARRAEGARRRARSRSGATRRSARRRARRCSTFARGAMGDANAKLEADELPLSSTANALRQLIAVSPDLQTCWDDGPLLQRLLAHRAAPPRGRRGRARAAGDRGRACRCPPAPGLDRRSFLARSAGLALAVYGGARARCRARSRRASPRPPRPDRRRVLVSVFLDGGADSLSMLSPAGDPLYRKLRPKPRAARLGRARRSPRTTRLRWHPSLAGARARSTARARSRVLPGDRLHRARTSRTSPRATSGRSARRTTQLRTGWLGRYLDRVGSPDNPLQGLSLDWRLQPALATAKMPVASIDGPDRTTSGRANVWGDVETRMLDAIGALGALPTHGDPALAQATSARAPVGAAARAAARRSRRRTTSPASRARSPTRRATTTFPRRLAGLAAMLAAGLPLRVVALARAGRLRHARRPAAGRSPDGPEADRRHRCSPSSATSRRAGSPTACSSTSGRSSAAARRRTARTAPTTARPAPAS